MMKSPNRNHRNHIQKRVTFAPKLTTTVGFVAGTRYTTSTRKRSSSSSSSSRRRRRHRQRHEDNNNTTAVSPASSSSSSSSSSSASSSSSSSSLSLAASRSKKARLMSRAAAMFPLDANRNDNNNNIKPTTQPNNNNSRSHSCKEAFGHTREQDQSQQQPSSKTTSSNKEKNEQWLLYFHWAKEQAELRNNVDKDCKDDTEKKVVEEEDATDNRSHSLQPDVATSSNLLHLQQEDRNSIEDPNETACPPLAAEVDNDTAVVAVKMEDEALEEPEPAMIPQDAVDEESEPETRATNWESIAAAPAPSPLLSLDSSNTITAEPRNKSQQTQTNTGSDTSHSTPPQKENLPRRVSVSPRTLFAVADPAHLLAAMPEKDPPPKPKPMSLRVQTSGGDNDQGIEKGATGSAKEESNTEKTKKEPVAVADKDSATRVDTTINKGGPNSHNTNGKKIRSKDARARTGAQRLSVSSLCAKIRANLPPQPVKPTTQPKHAKTDKTDAEAEAKVPAPAPSARAAPTPKPTPAEPELPRYRQDWLFKRYNEHFTRCLHMETTAHCKFGLRCRHAHCFGGHTEIPPPRGMEFVPKNYELTYASNKAGQIFFTAGYRHSKNTFIFPYGQGGRKQHTDGIWWYNSEQHALAALKAVVVGLEPQRESTANRKRRQNGYDDGGRGPAKQPRRGSDFHGPVGGNWNSHRYGPPSRDDSYYGPYRGDWRR